LAANFLVRLPDMSRVLDLFYLNADVVAISTCMASDPTEYFAGLICMVCERPRADLFDMLLSYFIHLSVEKPSFVPSVTLGFAVLRILHAMGAKFGEIVARGRWASVMPELIESDVVKSGLALALCEYRFASMTYSTTELKLVNQFSFTPEQARRDIVLGEDVREFLCQRGEFCVLQMFNWGTSRCR
jgi:hypothetical protein